VFIYPLDQDFSLVRGRRVRHSTTIGRHCRAGDPPAFAPHRTIDGFVVFRSVSPPSAQMPFFSPSLVSRFLKNNNSLNGHEDNKARKRRLCGSRCIRKKQLENPSRWNWFSAFHSPPLLRSPLLDCELNLRREMEEKKEKHEAKNGKEYIVDAQT
jgi:hypothetical protein